MENKNIIIIGGGPSGMTAALYASRGGLNPLIIEGKSMEAGGQLMLTTEVENYPGFESILGPDLIKKMRDHAAKFGAEFITEHVTEIDFKKRPFAVKTESGQEFKAKSIIISTGASARLLGLPSEDALLGKGVSTCATCDAPFFKDKETIVIGGGDSAMEEALALSKFASKVTVIHRRDNLRASKIMQDRAMKNKKISFIWDTTLVDILGAKERKVTGVKLKNLKTGETKEMKTDAVFYAIGHIPNTALFKDQIKLDDKGYIVTEGTKTSVPGVFAAGDVQDPFYRQAITSAGSGCMAALDAERFIGD